MISLVKGLASILALLVIAGCGGPSALTGGSIPIGAALVQVQVVRGDDVTQPLPGSFVTLKEDGVQNSAVTGEDGRVDLGKVQGGHYDVLVSTPGVTANAVVAGWDWDFDIPLGIRIQIIAAIWPAGFNPANVDNVTLSPQTITLHVGDAVRFVATADDLSGNALPVQPSLMLQGDIGELASDGRIQATKTGRGLLLCWLKGKTASAEIQVIP